MSDFVKLLHYSAESFKFNPSRRYGDGDDLHKPSGLWLSVEGDNDWKSWCENESFVLNALTYVSEVTLKSNANVLLIDTLDKLDNFNADFGIPNRLISWDMPISWGRVRAAYDGIIIAPYQFDRRHTLMWYYTWDCASGVIWNLSAVDCVTALSRKR